MDDCYKSYLKDRWETTEGKVAKDKIIECIQSYHHESNILEQLIHSYLDSSLEIKLQNEEVNKLPPFCLSKADLRGIVYKEIDLSNSQAFEAMDLSYSIFQGCTMISMNFHAAILAEARFEDCDLRKSSFFNSSGPDVVFLKCNLKDTIWRKAFYHGISFCRSNLKGTSIAGADCTGKKQDILT